MAKRVQISTDSGSNKYTFPGSKGELMLEASDIKDTILGQDFESGQTGLIGWSINTNGVYKGFAGYVAKILKSGTATTFSAEAATSLGSNRYQMTDSTKRVLDRNTALVIRDDSTPVTPSAIDWLQGIVTLSAPPGGTVTFHSGKYLPMTQVASAKEFSLGQTCNAIDNTTFEIAQGNGGYRTFEYGLKQASLNLKGIYASSNGFKALLADRSELVIEVNPDGNSKSICRGFFKPMGTGQSGDVGALEEESLDFKLSVPDQANVTLPLSWLFASDTTLSTALQKALTAWTDSDTVDVYYLADGTNGSTGEAIVTDVSLSGGLEVMNDFTVKFQGTDALVDHP